MDNPYCCCELTRVRLNKGGSYHHRGDIPLPVETIVDFWDTDKPASHLNGTGYEEHLFRDRMNQIINAHDPATPLYLNYDSKVAHYPQQVGSRPAGRPPARRLSLRPAVHVLSAVCIAPCRPPSLSFPSAESVS